MENKIITIYELMGLIKDGKAPYEIIYQGEKYFIDSLENFYRAMDTTPLFKRIFDNYNDYDALQEKVEIIKENDEWKDIEEIDNSVDDTLLNIECFTEIHEKAQDWNFSILKMKINQLIKNQKHLKERLDKNEN